MQRASKYSQFLSPATSLKAYPFGSALPGRIWSDAGRQYRYGFNGIEKDEDDVYSADFRRFDTRIGRWQSTDPVFRSYESPYSGFSNNPIVMIDPDGNSDFYTASGEYLGSDGTDGTDIHIVTDEAVIQQIKTNRTADANDPAYFLYSGPLETGTFFTLPPYTERQEIKKIMDTQAPNQRNEVGGTGYSNTDGSSTYMAPAVIPDKSEPDGLVDFAKQYEDNDAIGEAKPDVPLSVDVKQPADEPALKKWKGQQTGTRKTYTWHSHPYIKIYVYKQRGDSYNSYSIDDKPLFGQIQNIIVFGGTDAAPDSEPSEDDMAAAPAGSTFNNFVISKAAGTVTNHVGGSTQTTTMSTDNFYNLQAKKKPTQ